MAFLRDIDLGKCDGLEFTSISDLPAFHDVDDAVVIRCIIHDEHLSIGFNRHWDRYRGEERGTFSRSRFSSKGGMMYYKDVGLLRLWTSETRADRAALQALVLNTAVETVRPHAPSSSFQIIDNYAYIDGHKYAGVSANVINGKSNCILCVNKEVFPIGKMRRVFKNKRFDATTDLSALALDDSLYSQITDRFAQALGLSSRQSQLNADERVTARELLATHQSSAWLDDAVRSDLSWAPA